MDQMRTPDFLLEFPPALLRSRKRSNGMGAPEDFASSGAGFRILTD